ncbi:hypothetical protein KQX54_000621 [Cotesia glomerata]|uniref:Uncharacterized protein n=1 Tax=Cotesia glomerata TaxID=32391 RepID=A0AAV7HFW0_COTGL|nr:hypothetical protein KQX54_000621 [Cotesia glomerata]
MDSPEEYQKVMLLYPFPVNPIGSGQNKFPIDEKILFSRFGIPARPSNYQTYFAYELCPFPAFNLRESNHDPQNYGRQCTIVFDSMMSDLDSIKQSEKLLSLPATTVTTEIYFDESKSTTKKKEILFQNQKNKSRFIEELINVLRANGFMVKVTQLDNINRRIVDEAIVKSNEKLVTVIGGNVDALCLLATFTPNNSNIYFYIPGKKWYSTSIIQKQYQLLYPYLHIIRAITDCDVTSSFFNVSKKTC